MLFPLMAMLAVSVQANEEIIYYKTQNEVSQAPIEELVKQSRLQTAQLLKTGFDSAWDPLTQSIRAVCYSATTGFMRNQGSVEIAKSLSSIAGETYGRHLKKFCDTSGSCQDNWASNPSLIYTCAWGAQAQILLDTTASPEATQAALEELARNMVKGVPYDISRRSRQFNTNLVLHEVAHKLRPEIPLKEVVWNDFYIDKLTGEVGQQIDTLADGLFLPIRRKAGEKLMKELGL